MEWKTIPAGKYYIGSSEAAGFAEDQEGPQVMVELTEFQIGATPITNVQFAAFVEATGYVTDAERLGWSFVFGYFLTPEQKMNAQQSTANRLWYAVPQACWRQPEGEGSSIIERMDHPVVQVSRNDAVAYCRWAGCRLPSEAEWEVAAKGGTLYEKYPWGDDWQPKQANHCNIWQGAFPNENTAEDGYVNTAPVYQYEPNGYGCYQMIGNIWEWCSNPARIDLSLFAYTSGEQVWHSYQMTDDREYAIKGGSFLCHQSYCKRYRIAARNASKGMEATNHLGFRCVK
ncbi:formylglycine-generating enzyme family protein [Aerococcaceae bacterium NML190073]|nr:formylglycine-generating enzyme family protein [Aerococcaceae bacterium NML190073]